MGSATAILPESAMECHILRPTLPVILPANHMESLIALRAVTEYHIPIPHQTVSASVMESRIPYRHPTEPVIPMEPAHLILTEPVHLILTEPVAGQAILPEQAAAPLIRRDHLPVT